LMNPRKVNSSFFRKVVGMRWVSVTLPIVTTPPPMACPFVEFGG
jgi:hypothetical protein